MGIGVAIAVTTGAVLTFLSSARECSKEISKGISIVPKPVEMSVKKGRFVVDCLAVIVPDRASKRVGDYLADVLQPALGYRLAVVDAWGRGASIRKRGNIFLCVDDAVRPAGKKFAAEGYRLTVDKHNARISGGLPAGVFYGCQTLRQLLPDEILAPDAVAGVEWSLPCVRIEDHPLFGWRGVLLDVARHTQDTAALKNYIDELAFYKINRLQMHLTDNGKPYGGFYGQDEIRALVAYAQDRFITIEPEIEMPGHASTAAAAAYPHISRGGVPIEVQTKWPIFPKGCQENRNSSPFFTTKDRKYENTKDVY